MKNLVFILVIAISVGVSAQSKRTVKKTAPMASSSSNDLNFDSDSSSEVVGKLGFVSQAIHIGADYNKMTDGAGPGGYFFYQTNKKSGAVMVVNQVISLGGTYKMNFIDNSKFLAYVTPGFGIHMVKEVGVTGTGTPSDETLIGPVYKMGTQFKVKPTFAIGLERMAIVNWFSDKVPGGEYVFYSVAGTFWF